MPVSDLARKLHLKPGHRVLVLNAPAGYLDLLQPLPAGANLADKASDPCDCVQLFVRNVKELERHAPRAIKAVKPEGLLWISYPKISSKVATDLTRDSGWEVVEKAGWQGVALIAIDAVWSAFRFRPARDSKKSGSPRMSDAAVQARTGKTWPEWFALLDAAGARQWDHKGIVAYLGREYRIGGWWQQMVTVSYEQARDLRAPHEKPAGYEISRSKTIDVPVAKLFQAWEQAKVRGRWLKEAIVVRKATTNKSMRITWSDGKTSVDVNFYPKENAKTQVTVQHGKLTDAKQAERMKAFWSAALDRLKETLEA